MPDLATLAIAALAHRTPAMWGLVFLAGLVSSVGPCASPRIIALGALVLRARRPVVVGSAFLTGTLGTYALFGAADSLLGEALHAASWIYGAVALAGILGGIATVAGAAWHPRHEERSIPRCDAVGAALLTGSGFALMVSPCCTPILGVIVAYSAMAHATATGSLLLVVFGLGHAAPLLLVIAGGRAGVERVLRSPAAQAVQIVAGACMVALGGLYALLV